jgi:hypothetical protein
VNQRFATILLFGLPVVFFVIQSGWRMICKRYTPGRIDSETWGRGRFGIIAIATMFPYMFVFGLQPKLPAFSFVIFGPSVAITVLLGWIGARKEKNWISHLGAFVGYGVFLLCLCTLNQHPFKGAALSPWFVLFAGLVMFLLIATVSFHVTGDLRAWIPIWRAKRFRREAEGPCCTKCGYNLTGNASGVCPECGTRVPDWVNSSIRNARDEIES